MSEEREFKPGDRVRVDLPGYSVHGREGSVIPAEPEIKDCVVVQFSATHWATVHVSALSVLLPIPSEDRP